MIFNTCDKCLPVVMLLSELLKDSNDTIRQQRKRIVELERATQMKIDFTQN